MLNWFRRFARKDDAHNGRNAPLVQVVIVRDQPATGDQHQEIVDQQAEILRAIEEIESNIASYRAEVRMNARAMGVPLDEHEQPAPAAR